MEEEMADMMLKGAYARINLDHIVANYRQTCLLVGPNVLVSCVVKSDAYGHGEKQVVQVLKEAGLTTICVSTMIEAIRLRKQFPQGLEILILGYTPSFLADKASEYDLIQTISTLEEARILNRGSGTKVHIKVNTGMNRLGFSFEAVNLIEEVGQMANVRICGIFTHLHSSDSADKQSAEKQFRRFKNLLLGLEARGMEVGTRHVCNSGGIIDLPHMHLDRVRAGIMVYGLYPSSAVRKDRVDLKACMEFRSYIASLSKVSQGEGIGYGHTYVAQRDLMVATVNLGYSDGMFRQLSNNGQVIIHDQRRPIIGRVCMNMFMVDVTDMEEVAVEDEVIIFGHSGKASITIDEVAQRVGTISYDIVCRVGRSVPRAFIRHNQIIHVEEPLIVEGK